MSEWEKVTAQPNKAESEDRSIPAAKLPGKPKTNQEKTAKDSQSGRKRRTKICVNHRIMMGISRIDGKFYYHDLSQIPTAKIQKWPKHIQSAPTLEVAQALAKAYVERRRR